jgi:hypothetical protein
MLFSAEVQNLWLPCYFLVTFLWLSCDSHATFLRLFCDSYGCGMWLFCDSQSIGMRSTLSRLAWHMKISVLLIDGNLHLIFCVENVYGNIIRPWIHFPGSSWKTQLLGNLLLRFLFFNANESDSGISCLEARRSHR